MKKDGKRDRIVFMGRLRTIISGSICKDRRTANSVQIFEGEAGIDGPPNRLEFLMGCRDPRTAESVRSFEAGSTNR